MTWPIYITLFINIGGLIKLGQVFLIRGEDFLNHIRLLRLIFTLTLILLEFFIYLSPEPVGLSALQGFINDAEVFVTGILVGVLWQDRLLSLKLTFSNRSKN